MSSEPDRQPSAPGYQAAALAGTRWSLRSVRLGSGAQSPAIPGAGATLTFGPEDGIAGSSGCNRFTASYAQSGTRLTITPVAHTLRACIGPVASQEAALFAVLPLVAQAGIGGSGADRVLSLFDAAGGVLATYGPGRDSALGTWAVTGINNGHQAVVSSAWTQRVTATFGSDGTLTGSTGVNRFTTRYTLTHPNGMALGPVATTRRGGPPDAMVVERELLAALAAVATYELDGEHLTLRDAQGASQLALIATTAPARPASGLV